MSLFAEYTVSIWQLLDLGMGKFTKPSAFVLALIVTATYIAKMPDKKVRSLANRVDDFNKSLFKKKIISYVSLFLSGSSIVFWCLINEEKLGDAQALESSHLTLIGIWVIIASIFYVFAFTPIVNGHLTKRMGA
ncbi:hypothetical protein [Alteromonas australica]|uniref:hypothetical protein n=1 Tax=Alteromonas australica TaxID=589873 RepID=UPI0035C80181